MQVLVRTEDIPPQGRHFEFELDRAHLNERIAAVREAAGEEGVLPPEYVFEQSPEVKLDVSRRGNSVSIRGELHARFRTSCARCAEDALAELEAPIKITLEKSVGKEAEQEDVELGYYSGDEIELQQVVEEFAVLALPFSVLCSESCKGLCPTCGANLNLGACACRREAGDERFAVLRGLKIQ